MKTFKNNLLLSLVLFSFFPFFISGGFSSDDSKPSPSSHIKKGSLADLKTIDKNTQTLADLITAERQKEREEKPSKRKTLSELFEIEDIKAEEFNEFLNETKENQHLLDIVFVPQQNFENYTEVFEQQTEKWYHLKSMKEKDPIMSQLMEKLTKFAKELKSGNVSHSLKQYLFFTIEISALRQQIPISEIIVIKKEKFEMKLIAKLIKLLMKEKRQNRQQKQDKNDEKSKNSKEKQKLRLMYTAVDNLNIVANIQNDSDRKNKRNRRKKRFMESPLFMAILILLICSIFVYLVNNIGTWLYNRGWDPISLGQKAMSKFKQHNVSKAIKKMPEHQINGQSDGIQQCAICLSNYKNGEKVRELMCKHNFHTKCVDIWIKQQNNCPICREEIFEISLLGKVRPKNNEQQQQHSTAVIDEKPENSLINTAENV